MKKLLIILSAFALMLTSCGNTNKKTEENNLSVDCDCNAHPADPEMKDIGILASTDPVALDQACLALVFAVVPEEGNDNQPLIERINSRHGTHIVDYAEQIGLGSKKYELVNID